MKESDRNENLTGVLRKMAPAAGMKRAARTWLEVAAVCCLFVFAGCGGGTPSVGNGVTPGGGNGATTVATPRVDWGMSLGPNGTAGPGQFPAKFTFDATAPPDCTNDFVVFNTSVAGSTGSTANIVAFNQLYSTQGSVGGLCNQMDHPSIGPITPGQGRP